MRQGGSQRCMRNPMLPIFFAAALAAPAQIVSFGVKAGLPLSTAPFGPSVEHGRHTETGRWAVGPTVEFHVTPALSIEAEALYRAYNVTGGGSVPSTVAFDSSYSYRDEVKAWDFPLLLKYRFLHGPIRPFVDAGLSLTHESVDVTTSCLGPSCIPYGYLIPQAGTSTVKRNRRGDVAGGGVEFRYGKVKIAPEVRYTRLTNPGGNQTMLMVGFTF
jgi:Outer membrane protein beta-barrel domain